MTAQKQVLVLGIGNTLMGDDGLGVRIIEAFERTYEVPSCVEVIDGGTGGLKLLELFQDFESVIVIDAVVSDSPAGTVHVYRDEELRGAKQPVRVSAHQIGLFELLETARLTGHEPSVSLIGVVPERIAPGENLSKRIEKRTTLVAEKIVQELKRLDIECETRPLPHA